MTPEQALAKAFEQISSWMTTNGEAKLVSVLFGSSRRSSAGGSVQP